MLDNRAIHVIPIPVSCFNVFLHPKIPNHPNSAPQKLPSSEFAWNSPTQLFQVAHKIALSAPSCRSRILVPASHCHTRTRYL
ncbi:hypothetical protein BJX66DRAFT_20851 [Aspergillus keveii]|uniref:Uncharacterized protein n=1 Tax=Aspergillus keveii TaxID=714993 RepID=A0ABR4FUE4_9EURO